MRRRWFRGIALAAAFAAHCRPEAPSLVTTSNSLLIKVYDDAHLSREVLLDALDQLRLILRQATIDSHPVLGNPGDGEASLFMYVPAPADREPPRIACGARRDIALRIIGSSPGSLKACVLGMSSPFAAIGLNVRLFNDHIREAALEHGLPLAVVLSHAMAHEIGHVLLRNGSHSHLGLMSGIWTKHEYEQMARSALEFSNTEAKTMATNLRAPACRP